MQQTPSWEAYGHSSTDEIPTLLNSLPPFITFTKTHNWNLCCAQWIQSTTSRYCTDNRDYHCYKHLSTVTRLLGEHLRNQKYSWQKHQDTYGAKKPHIQWVLGHYCPGVKRRGHWDEHSPQSTKTLLHTPSQHAWGKRPFCLLPLKYKTHWLHDVSIIWNEGHLLSVQYI